MSGPKKLLVFGGANVEQAVADYSSIGFHETYLRPFYDWCLKGEQTSYVTAPAVRYVLTGSDKILSAASLAAGRHQLRNAVLSTTARPAASSRSTTARSTRPPPMRAARRPSSRIRIPAGPTASSAADPTAGPIPHGACSRSRRRRSMRDTQVVGPIELILYASSSNTDTDFFVKLSDQAPGTDDDQKAGLNPRYSIVTKGWLRASHRALDPKWSLPHAPWYTDAKEQPLHPGQIYKFDIAVMPTAHLFKKGSRIRLELANGDSADDRRAVHAPLQSAQARRRHDLSRCPASFGAAAPALARRAGDRRCPMKKTILAPLGARSDGGRHRAGAQCRCAHHAPAFRATRNRDRGRRDRGMCEDDLHDHGGRGR